MSSLKIDPGSFRDPSGNILNYDDKIFRILKKEGADRIKFLKETNLLNQSISNKFLIESKFIDAKDMLCWVSIGLLNDSPTCDCAEKL